jgi:hypothetical protein
MANTINSVPVVDGVNDVISSGTESLWGDRSRGLFIDAMVKSAAVLNRFTLIDGVKAKVNVPIFEVGAQTFGLGDDCGFSDTTPTTITEKEMSVQTFSWGFKNCKAVLEKSYRGVALKKGQHNPETMDVEFRNWVYDYFAKLAAQKALTYAGSELLTEMKADADVIDFDTDANTSGQKVITSTNILDIMQSSYEAMSDVMLSAVYGDADREFRPAFFLGTVAYQAFQIAMAEEFASSMTLSSSDGIAKGAIPTYYGMEVIHLSSLAADHLFVTPPSNLVMLTDDYNDVAAIDSEYEAKENSEYLWGRFKLGFSYLKGSEIVLAYDV